MVLEIEDSVDRGLSAVESQEAISAAVLLSTYNGEQYLREQLDSLIDQSHQNIVVHVRDDGSTDGTVAILQGYQSHFPEKFKVYIGDNLGSSASFYWLLENVRADVYFFCDQDDVWFRSKVEQHLERYRVQIEPEMVFSDLEIMGARLGSGKNTLLSLQKMDPDYLVRSVIRMLCQNPVAGCAMSLNHAAKEQIFKLGPMPGKVVHDHWFAVVTAMYGSVYFLPQPLICYRLHADNQIGSQTFNFGYVMKKLMNMRATILYDLRLLGSLPKADRPSLLNYIVVKVLANLKRIF